MPKKTKADLENEVAVLREQLTAATTASSSIPTTSQEVPPGWLQHLLQAQETARLQTEERFRMLLDRLNISENSSESNEHRRNPAKVDPKKPPVLENDVSLTDFDTWRETWDDYLTITDYDNFPQEKLVALFMSFLSQDMRHTVRHALNLSPDDNMSVDGILDRIRQHIRDDRNITLDYLAFETRKQEEGETFNNFLVNLRILAKNAELCDHCLDTRLTTKILSGISDSDTRQKLLEIRPFPTLQKAIDLCRSQE